MVGSEHTCSWKRHGQNRNGNRRFRCRLCGKTKTAEPRATPRYDRTMKGVGVAEYFLSQGYSIRYAACKAGLSNRTVMTHCKDFLAREDLKCGCGAARGHRGWCKWMYEQSPLRQGWIKVLHGESTKAELEAMADTLSGLYDTRCNGCGVRLTRGGKRCSTCWRSRAAKKRTAQPEGELECLKQGRKLLRKIREILASHNQTQDRDVSQ